MTWKTKSVFLVALCGLMLGFALTPLAAQDTPPVAQDGPYAVGTQILNLVDADRGDRALQTFVWYPAIVGDDRPYAPDDTGAPYPLIIYTHGFGGSNTELTPVINRLVSSGFVVVAATHPDARDGWLPLVDRPLDIQFVLSQITDLQDNSLVGLIDTDNVGVLGFSYGGYTTIAAGGARLDMDYFQGWCAENGSLVRADYCSTSEDWDRTEAYYAERHPDDASDDGLWTAVTDERIKAIMPMAPCFGQMFGPEGLAAVSVPALMVGGTSDVTCPYEYDAAYYYANLGSGDRYLVSLDKRDHIAVLREAPLLAQYAAAFFGYYLQDNEDYAQYLTPESAEGFRNVRLEATLAE